MWAWVVILRHVESEIGDIQMSFEYSQIYKKEIHETGFTSSYANVHICQHIVPYFCRRLTNTHFSVFEIARCSDICTSKAYFVNLCSCILSDLRRWVWWTLVIDTSFSLFIDLVNVKLCALCGLFVASTELWNNGIITCTWLTIAKTSRQYKQVFMWNHRRMSPR